MILGWAVFFLEALLACGVVGAALFYGKRIGGFGPYVLAVVPVIALVERAIYMVMPYVTHEMVARGGMAFHRVEVLYTTLSMMTTSFAALIALLLVSSLVLMRR